MENKVKDLDSIIKETFKGDLNATRKSFKEAVKKILLEINFNDKCNLSIITGQAFHGNNILCILPSFVSAGNFGESEYKQILGKLIEKIQAVNIQDVMEKKAELNQEKKNQQSQINNFCDKNFIGYIRNKIANDKSNYFFAISEAINKVDLELSMRELDELAK